jgi:uncharacterized protein with PIN domain
MHRRIVDGYRWRFERLLRPLGLSDLGAAVKRRLGRAIAASSRHGKAVGATLAERLAETRKHVRRLAERMRPAAVAEANPPVFGCDASLAGLARWLRAAGYEAHVMQATEPARGLAEASDRGWTLLTTDSRAVALRRACTSDAPLLWLPSDRTRQEQLADVLAELRLPLRDPRCMDCSGALESVAKESVRDRIPPRTALWKDEYDLCASCGKLLWRGTHWERIADQLRIVAGAGEAK